MDKIQALRKQMKEHGVDAFLVPNTDEYQGEYTAPCARRLEWLTGFSGSAGFAVITSHKAVFFTDGRYTLQAKDQLPDFFEIYNTAEKTPMLWANENLSDNFQIGYDPWLFTEQQLKSYRNNLVPISPNPIDSLWEDRPKAPYDYIRLHPLEFAGESDESKRKRICESLKADNVLITASDSIAWLLNIRGNDVPHTPIVHSYCLIRKDGSYDLFVDLRKANGKTYKHVKEGKGQIIEIKMIAEHLKKIKGSCQYDPFLTPVSLIQILESANIPTRRERDPCILPKAIKNETELEGAEQAHIQDGNAMVAFMEWLKNQPLKGETTELSASDQLLAFRQKGKYFQDTSFDTISGFGPHGAIIHYRVTPETNIPLEKNNLYLVDSGGQYLNGTTDVTRTIALGKPTKEQIDRYTRVLKGHIALATAIFPEGTTGAQLDVLARQSLWDVGCNYAHGTGHGVGSYLGVHEGPQGISTRGTPVPLVPGMMLSNEPGYYKEGEYGIRIENIVKVVALDTPQGYFGFETITLVPLDTKLINPDLLTNKEKQWIEDYHEKIKKTLGHE